MGLIVLDFDGTLADTWRDIATALNATLAEAGLAQAPGEQVREWIGHGVVALLRRAAGSDDPQRIAPLQERFRVHYDACCLETTTLYPGMAAALERLAGHRLAVLSNKPGRFLDRIVAGLGLERRFVAVVGGDALPVAKPDPATLAHTVAAAGGGDGPVWMVGDSAVDIETGRRFGARTIGCAWGLRGAAELHAAGAGLVIDHPAELPAAVAAAVPVGRPRP